MVMTITRTPESLFAEKILAVVLPTVKKGISNAAEIYGRKIIKQWQNASDSNSVPNSPTASPSYKKWKQSVGLNTEDLQRLGRGDSRSYYRNIIFRPLYSGDGWFVGVLDTTPAFVVSAGGDGKYKVESAPYSLAEVAENLEERFPLWQRLYTSNMSYFRNEIASQIGLEFEKLGYMPRRGVG